MRVQDVGLAQVKDPVILAWAAKEDRILLTHDQGKSFDFHSSIDAKPLREMTIVEFTQDGESLNELPLLIGNRKGSISTPFRADKEGDVLLRLVVR